MEVNKSSHSLPSRLKAHPARMQLIGHGVFEKIRTAPLDAQSAAVLLGQWWHPLHYFPAFLARSIATLPDIASRCAIAKILYQESGEGDPERAHEVVYIRTMLDVGFQRRDVDGAAPFAETAELVAGYERASTDLYDALGFLFATELADLAMVSGIGVAVSRVTGVDALEWVDIHIRQEPDHVEEADHTMLESYTAEEQSRITAAAERMWFLWIRFFDRVEREMQAIAMRSSPQAARAAG